MALAQDVGFGAFPLRVERIKLLIQTLFGRLPRVDGATKRSLGSTVRFVHGHRLYLESSLVNSKKAQPFQRVPVAVRATALKEA